MKGLIAAIIVSLLGTTAIANAIMNILEKPFISEADYIALGVILIVGTPSVLIFSYTIYLIIEEY